MFRKAVLLLLLTEVIYINTGFSDNTKSIHPFLSDKKSCDTCHMEKNITIKINNPAEACAPQCMTCHKNMDNHHSINIRINDKLPDKIMLTKKKKIICRTCHKLNSKRYDTKSWKAESMFEKIFKGKDKYKTFFLIKNNSDGQLCKTCH